MPMRSCRGMLTGDKGSGRAGHFVLRLSFRLILQLQFLVIKFLLQSSDSRLIEGTAFVKVDQKLALEIVYLFFCSDKCLFVPRRIYNAAAKAFTFHLPRECSRDFC